MLHDYKFKKEHDGKEGTRDEASNNINVKIGI